jgi:transcriptional regulator with XRE-family HTH domain
VSLGEANASRSRTEARDLPGGTTTPSATRPAGSARERVAAPATHANRVCTRYREPEAAPAATIVPLDPGTRGMPPTTQRPYTVSAQTLARDEMRAALRARDFGAVFRLMKKWDGASQDRIASPVEGLTQSRVSRIMRGEDRIQSLDLIERIADAHRIPGPLLGLAPRAWESTDPPPAARPVPADASTPTDAAPLSATGEIVERSLGIDIDVADDGWATLTYRHELRNDGAEPLTRVSRELWFEETNGPRTIQTVLDLIEFGGSHPGGRRTATPAWAKEARSSPSVPA